MPKFENNASNSTGVARIFHYRENTASSRANDSSAKRGEKGGKIKKKVKNKDKGGQKGIGRVSKPTGQKRPRRLWVVDRVHVY